MFRYSLISCAPSESKTPNIRDLQRELYEQLTGFIMSAQEDATIERQLEEMRAAGRGQRWLIGESLIDDFRWCNLIVSLVVLDGESLVNGLCTLQT